MALKLNNISNDIFNTAAFHSDDHKVRVCRSNGTTHEISRNDIVATGRLVACEYIGSKLNERPGEKYVSKLNGMDYGTLSRTHADSLLLFCATKAYQSVGKDAPSSVDEVKNDISLARNHMFLANLAAITRDVIQPLVFRVYDDVAAGLMQWEALPLGGTKEIEIASNDVFLFEDSSWGSGRSASYNHLYAKTITLNPTMYACQAKIKWYQDIVNGEPGR